MRDDWRDGQLQRRVNYQAATKPTIDFAVMAAQCEAALKPHQRGMLASELRVSTDALYRLQVGWSECHRSYTFPMRDRAEDGVARGIRLRRPDGGKLAVKGSRQGLFVPRNFPVGDMLVVCEGPTDAAALLMLGFDAVGRPSCNGGVALVVDLVEQHHFAGAVIVADGDLPGQRGARYVATCLLAYVPDGVRVVTPPVKDAREWVRRGAGRLDVLNAIKDSCPIMLTYSGRAER